MVISFKGAHFPPQVILMGGRWYLAYPLSTRHVEELMEERGMHMLRKGQMEGDEVEDLSVAEQFYALAS